MLGVFTNPAAKTTWACWVFLENFRLDDDLKLIHLDASTRFNREKWVRGEKNWPKRSRGWTLLAPSAPLSPTTMEAIETSVVVACRRFDVVFLYASKWGSMTLNIVEVLCDINSMSRISVVNFSHRWCIKMLQYWRGTCHICIEFQHLRLRRRG